MCINFNFNIIQDNVPFKSGTVFFAVFLLAPKGVLLKLGATPLEVFLEYIQALLDWGSGHGIPYVSSSKVCVCPCPCRFGKKYRHFTYDSPFSKIDTVLYQQSRV